MPLVDISESFDPNNEETLKFVVAKYFLELGFDVSELSFEDRFEIYLGHPSISTDNRYRDHVTDRSDILEILLI